ncbi:MAG: hypothetical protein ABI411_19080 [Tahibacter sp.]
MRYHDCALDKYEVSDRGETISLYLVCACPGKEADKSCIRFSHVALYNFVHTGGATITDIEELPVADLLREIGAQVADWNRWYGVHLWKSGIDDYIALLQEQCCRAWRIESAIGFHRFVIAHAIACTVDRR